MSNHRRCEICSISAKDRGGFFANFPLDENRCKEWVRVVGKLDLAYLPIEKLHQIRFVCGDHFGKKDFNKKGTKLLKRAIPKLKLTAVPLTDEQLEEFPLRPSSKPGVCKDVKLASSASIQKTSFTLMQDHSYCIQPQPSTSQRELSHTSILIEPQPGPSTSSQAFPITTVQAPSIAVQPQISKNQHDLSYTASVHVQNEKTPKKQRVLAHLSQKGSEGIRKRRIIDDVDLTPRKKKLVEQLQKTKCTLASLKKSAKLLESVNSVILKDLVAADLKNKNKKPKGRRWTLKEKIAALAIFKRSPKTYRFLENGLMLPSIKTLNNLLRKIPMETGINKAVLQHLKKQSPSMDEHNKLCVILFDEIALKPRLIYNEATDQVDGYEDKGKQAELARTPRIANHALVFMIQGLRARYKQLIAYYFIKGTVSSQQLAVYIKEVIKAVNDTGFRVMTTVCDQGPTNMGALKLLKEGSLRSEQFTGSIESCNYFITADGIKIYIMYDIPHLFKSIRNNFMNHGQIEIESNRGKWAHLYEVEEKNNSLLYLSKITSTHVRPKYRAKMKVKYAAQVLSNTVSAVLKLMSQAESDDQRKKEIMQTGLVIEFLDRLFDATNGPSCKEDIKRGQRQNVSITSNHIELWSNLKRKISGLKFIKNDGTEAKNVKCIQGMLISLETLQDVWNDVRNLGFRYLNLRSLNQDGLENFFGIIRQHSPTNRNPTCAGFIAALKTSVISGMTAPHSKSSNCEKDNKVLLTNFEDTLLENDTHEVCSEVLPVSTTDLNIEVIVPKPGSSNSSDNTDGHPVINIPEEIEIETDLSQIKFQPLVYVCGYLMSTLQTLDCAACRRLLIEDDVEKKQSELYQYIQLREWWGDKASLTYPSLPLCRMLETATNVFESDIIPRLHELDIATLCITLFTTKCDLTWFTCHHRNFILDVIFGRVARLLIRRQCQRLNQEFAEHEERIKDITKRAEQVIN